ncbi:hypothetical protein AURDEDRAFT_186814 [Auricularia subglabra TFB-10046 SS5]|uniref:Alpha/beta-hydrolase n=1 Tax=Auricularia subglabra (strain TFB-10046 / SS5) TaxID=717982 RepID=J0LJQ9_AURST|nr:hypothetical protein AURDEDRAFT_186814 [Auricularia subglabra TFB-10046 SS5]
MVPAIFPIALVALVAFSDVAQAQQALPFSPCDGNEDLQCGFISVPRDYRNASAARTEIAIARYPATDKENRIGTLFIDPGGPGASGIEFAFAIAKPLSKLFLGRYDIVGLDPRGVGRTRPAVACFPTLADDQIFHAGTPLVQSFEIPPGDPASPESRAVILQQMREWLAASEAMFDVCQDAPESEDLVHMSTATVVRDLDYMTTVLDGAGALINYWGVSYGTLIGSYLVNMFPERVGRVAIDGVINPDQWANQPGYKLLDTWMHKTEAAFDYILASCGTAGPEMCALAHRKGETAREIGHKIDGFLAELYARPVAVPHTPRPSIITSGMARALLYQTTNSPKFFPRVAAAVASAINGNFTDLASMTIAPIVFPSVRVPGDHAASIVSCLDAPPYDPDRSDTWPTVEALTDDAIERLRTLSPRFGLSPMLFERHGACQYLSKVAQQLPERFTGPFNHTLRNLILIVNGDLDPLTPLINAQYVNKQLGKSSRLVIQTDSPAHTSFFFGPSLCVGRAYREHFVYGRLPGASETVCQGDQTVFDTDASHVSVPDLERDAGESDLRAVVKELSQVFYNWQSPGLPP